MFYSQFKELKKLSREVGGSVYYTEKFEEFRKYIEIYYFVSFQLQNKVLSFLLDEYEIEKNSWENNDSPNAELNLYDSLRGSIKTLISYFEVYYLEREIKLETKIKRFIEKEQPEEKFITNEMVEFLKNSKKNLYPF